MIYVRVNKAASTSTAAFVKGHCDILQITELSKRVDRFGGWLDRERLKNQKCFTVVRNPYARAVSCWHHCQRLGFKYTFEQWLEKTFHAMKSEECVHSLRQVDFLFDMRGSMAWIDHILKLEQTDFVKRLQEITGIKAPFPHEAKGGYSKKEDPYTPYARELVKEKYYLDFKILGYGWDY